MELKEAIGRRRSIRFLRPYKPVEREKIQRMLEAARLASFWGNVQALKAVVIERDSAPKDVIDALPVGTAIGGFQFRMAPVVIVWFIDWKMVDEQGTRLHELVDAGAIGVDREKSHHYLDQVLIPFFEKSAERIRTNGVTEVDCGQGIAQATLVAFEEGLGTCVLAAFANKKLRRALQLPAEAQILLLQTVGYPAEDPQAGGQRPKQPFEEKFYLNRHGDAFPQSAEVVDELRRAGMIQETAPLPYRDQELEYLKQAFGLSDVFGDETPAVIEAAAAETGASE